MKLEYLTGHQNQCHVLLPLRYYTSLYAYLEAFKMRAYNVYTMALYTLRCSTI